MASTFDLFLTHDWGIDEEGRDNHVRVAELNRMLKQAGFQTWFDDERMEGHIVQQMCEGIDGSRVVLVFITSRYLDKVNAKGEDNCKSEFDYALKRKGTKFMLPIVMEKSMLDDAKWTGPVCMKLGQHLYFNMSSDEAVEMNFFRLVKRLSELVPGRAQCNNAPPALSGSLSPRGSTMTSSASSAISQGRNVAEWSIVETCEWLTSIGLECLHDSFKAKKVTGKKLMLLKPASIAKSFTLDAMDQEVLISAVTELITRHRQSSDQDAAILAELSRDYGYILSTYPKAETPLLNQHVGQGTFFRNACIRLVALADLKAKSRGMWGLGHHLNDQETVTLADGRIMSKKQLYTEAIKLDIQLSFPYLGLAGVLSGDDTVTLVDGRVMNNKDLYIEAIKMDRQFSYAYYGLACLLSGEETVMLADHRVMNNKLLYVEAIRLNPQLAYAYYGLATIMSDTDTETLADGRVMTNEQLYIEAIKWNNELCYAYNNLAIPLTGNQTVTLADGRIMTNKVLYVEAIRLNNQYVQAYIRLAIILNEKETVTLADGRILTNKDLYIEVIKINNQLPEPYYNLAYGLWHKETVTLADGRVMNNKDLYIEAIRLDSTNPKYYKHLSIELYDAIRIESITLHDGRVMTAKMLRAEAKKYQK